MAPLDLRPFQRQFLRGALDPAIDTAALSIPRGNGKTRLAAAILERCLTPGDPLFEAGKEYCLMASSLEQARLCFRFLRQELEPTGAYRFIDSVTRVGLQHSASKTRLRVLSSNPKTALGLVNTPLLVADEPGAWEAVGGELMFDALQTAQGKPGSPVRVIYIGTLAPSRNGWWHDLVARGTTETTYVQALQGDRERWDAWSEIRRCNPLVEVAPEFRKKLLQERDEALGDTRLKARFLSYRLNVPIRDKSQVLLTPEDWSLVASRDLPDRNGPPVVGIDLGGGRAWSAACAIWESGRCEVLAVAPGIPSLAEQERRDRVPAGLYERLHEEGLLLVAEGLRVQPVTEIWSAICARWGIPDRIVCDRFNLHALQDVVYDECYIEPRVTRWSEASADIGAVRKIAKDGPLAVPVAQHPLLIASLAVATVKNDDQGSVRLIKNSTANAARDDVAVALTLAAGAYQRLAAQPQPAPLRYTFA